MLLFGSICIGISSCKPKKKQFEILSSTETNINFTNTLEKHPLFSILYYLYYYNGGGVATGDINNDGLPDIYFTANHKGGNKLFLNKGNFKFEDITEKAGVAGTSDWCNCVTMADVNGDGLLDIYVSTISNKYELKGRNELFINKGEGVFKESAKEYGLDISCFTTQTAFFDYDHDGDLDCYILNQSHHPHANIVDTSNRRKYDSLSGDRLYRNDMNTPAKRFTDVSASAGIYQSNLGYGLGLAIADINNDGWDDIYIGNDFHENDYYYVNNGNGTFTESGAKYFNHYSRFSMGNDIADYNNDGQLDIVTVDMLPPDEKVLKTYGSDENPEVYKFKLERNGYQQQQSKNCLQRNNGSGSSFSEIALLSGISATDWSWCPLFADFDNDGNKDIFVSSGIVKRPVDLDYVRFVSNLKAKGMDRTDKFDDEAINAMPDGSSHPFFFRGKGSEIFNDVSNDWGTGNMKGYYNGASYADLDNDGNLDLIINCIDAPAVLLKNNTSGKNYLSILFKGDSLNTHGIGAKAYLFSKNKMQYQQLMLTRGFQSSSDTRLHFGLDSLSAIDSLLIVWPNQKYQLIKNPAANKRLVVFQKDASGVFDYASFFKPATELLVDVTNTVNVNWQHKENSFTDFNLQYLIPHEQSTRGPKIAVGDVNGDGLDDFYVCGAKDQAGKLFIQQVNGTFIPADTAVFNADAPFEDVDALFFDADKDNDLDLYIVSGGNEYVSNDKFLSDRLYINDGKGHFNKAINSLPVILQNKSCVSTADIDKDGDNDLFVGVLADAKAFGVPQTSYLLLNDGKGNFSAAPPNVIKLNEIGLVTTSAFTDINKDGFPDLLVAGEWMPITVFTNKKGEFEKSIVPNSSGLWQTIFIDDVNSDGNADILAGNWGWNNKFHSGKDGPVKMYVADFDRNGKTEQLLSYTANGEEYPFLAKDEVERALPLLKKHYLLYAEYAGVIMKDVFYGWIDTIRPVIAEKLGSAVCYGDGKGRFNMNELSADLQLSPIFSFQKIGFVEKKSGYLSGGNFFGVTPYEGRYDAQALALATAGNNNLDYLGQQNLDAVKGEVRDIKWLRTAGNKKILVVARNDDRLLFYVTKNER